MTFKEWLIKKLGPDNDENDDEACYLEDLASYGASAGFPGLTYYDDTCALYNEYTEEMWDVLRSTAEDWDTENVLKVLATCTGAKDVDTDTTFKNFVVWLVAEHYAAEWLNNREDRDNDDQR